MAFPQTPLPAHVYIAPGVDPAGDPSDWTWTEITDDVRVDEGIEITAGRGDEASRVDPGKCTIVIDNRSGDYAPRNPLGQWYGDLSKNTPLQVRLERGYDVFDRVRASGWGTSDSGHQWLHTNASSWTADGSIGIQTKAAANTADYAVLDGANAHDVDILYAAAMPVVTTGGPMACGALVRYSSSSDQYRVFTEFHPAGVLKIAMSKTVAGSFSYTTIITAGITYSAGQIIWTRVQGDGPTLRARLWADGSPEPSTWQAIDDDATELYGTGVGFYVWRQPSNTNVGSLAINFHHFETTSFLFTGTVAEWPVRWDQSGNDCMTSIEAAGIIRRLQQGKSALRSPLYRQLTGYNPSGYWPLEDGSDATVASPAAINGVSAVASDVTFASDETLAGAGAVLKLNSATSFLRGRVMRSTGSGFSAMFLMKLAALPAAKTTFMEWSCSGTVKTWRISGDATGMFMEGLSADGTVITGGAGGIYVVDPTEWAAYQVEAVLNAGNVDWSLIWHQVGTTDFWSTGGSIAGSVGVITLFYVPGSTGLVDANFAHVYAGADTLPFVDTGFALVSNGYSGELAADRVQRLCDEEGVRVYVESGTSAAMGRQRTETFLDLLYACEDGDLGLLYESGAALAYRPHGARLNVDTEVALDFAVGDVADPPEPTDDDQRVRNDIVAKRDDGGEYRAADEAHIALVGRYDEAIEVNVASDDQLPDVAGWYLHLGTWDEMRWPHITIDLARNDNRIGAWHSMMRPGARFSISNPPDQVAGDELDLIVEGYRQKLSLYSWDVDITCSPARAWDIAETDSTDWRADTEGSELSSSVTSTATSMSVATTSGPLWTTSGSEVPFDLNVGGERVTVTAISGGASPQTFTVTRSVNGIVMAHASGDDVRLWTDARPSIV